MKFSGREFIPDFVFPAPSLVLEVKLIKLKSHVSSSVEEMSADIPAFLSSYRDLVFCVYDLGEIRDLNEFQHGFSTHDRVHICVIKH